MIKEQKKQIRRKALACRNALTEPERERGKLLITERILGHQWYYLSDTILGFVSYGSEICTTEILESALQDGKSVYVPKVEDGKMEFYRMFSLSELKNGYKKIPEPAGDTDRYLFEPEHEDKTLLLMPGSAFDPLGNRMGYGGGQISCGQRKLKTAEHRYRFPLPAGRTGTCGSDRCEAVSGDSGLNYKYRIESRG